MDLHRISLIFLHICSSLSYIPHLVIHIANLSFNAFPRRSQIAFTIYWCGYCLLILGVLLWSCIILCKKRVVWQVIQVSGHVLIGKLLYTMFDVIVRILLHYRLIIILFDIIHVVILIPAITITFALAQDMKKKQTVVEEIVNL
ncbi:unnamed protein product [Adineta ricciae]|uniref:Uncharacterized protein n=1 Tax=Adineta ricciae TaxID=249248 RepID=A0A813WSE5_ADIRI|nr:unnamed protein product [Adineta ricciae]CAF1096723.1 unnamed protein product [Adineta ricciae]